MTTFPPAIEQLRNELGTAQTELDLWEMEHGSSPRDIDLIFEHDLRLRRVSAAKSALRCAMAQRDHEWPAKVDWL